MLAVDKISNNYDESQVLFEVSLEIGDSEVVGLLGRNGMGKTTTVKSIMGMFPARSGTIQFDGKPIGALAPYLVARLGIGLVPEGRRIFPTLSVKENLVAVAIERKRPGDAWNLDRVLDLFPALGSHLDVLAGLLSGGEQQMLAIGRALMTNPRLMILDEATEGLAPMIRDEIWQALRNLKSTGMSILIIDKNIDALLSLAQRHYILEKGRVVWSGTSKALSANSEILDRHLGMGNRPVY